MTAVESIFAAIKPAALAREMGTPAQTVWEWSNKGHIPHWRRQSVIDALERKGIPICGEAAEYLASRDRAKAA